MKLKEIVKIKGGKRLPKGDLLQSIPNSHPYIKVKDMKNKFISFNDLEYVPNKTFEKIKNYIVNTNDVLISIVGTIGLVSIIDEKLNNASQSENCAKLSGLDNIDAQYLYYFLYSPLGQNEIKKSIVGAVQQKLPLYNIENIEIDWKEKNIRKNIVEKLSLLDDKITLNNQTNQTLEQMAQAIFKHWFIDFAPVHAKAEVLAQGGSEQEAEQAAMQSISGKTAAELTALSQTNPTAYQQLQQTAAAFPSEFMESEQGRIPKGWELSSITNKKICQIIKPKINPFSDEKDYIATANVSKNNIVGTLEKITFDKRPSRANMQPIIDSIWFAKMVGEHKAIMIDKDDKLLLEKTILSTGFLGINPKPYKKCFLYCFINSDAFTQLKNSLATGAVQIALNNTSFSSMNIILPNDNILELFDKKLNKIFSKISANNRENQTLAQTRDTLLPKLLNGEVEL